MELNPNLNTGVLTPTFTKTERKRQWLELCENLNAQGGPEKTVEQWKKVNTIHFYSFIKQ